MLPPGVEALPNEALPPEPAGRVASSRLPGPMNQRAVLHNINLLTTGLFHLPLAALAKPIRMVKRPSRTVHTLVRMGPEVVAQCLEEISGQV